jgi:hypothetical protein
MSAVWDESAALIRREQKLLIPVALATIGIGSFISGFTQPETAGAGLGIAGIVGFIIGNILSLIGNLAIMALALMPGMSVAESLNLAMSRLPKMLAVAGIFLIGVIVMIIPVALAIGFSGEPISENMTLQELPAIAILVVAIVSLVLFYLLARLITLTAVIVDQNPPAVEAVRSSFMATREIAAKVVGVMLLFLVVTLVVSGAATSISGILFGMIGKAVGAPFLGKGLAVLVTGMISALISIVSTVFAAMLYRKLSAQ